jgi:streptomycin 6-kinase
VRIPDDLPAIVRSKALAAGAGDWLDALPRLVAELEEAWGLRVDQALAGGTEAFVAAARLADGSAAVLKLAPPSAMTDLAHEITTLRLAGGEGCARLLQHDPARGALLTERLGTPLAELGLPVAEQHELLCATVRRVWRPAPGCGLPTGAEKGRRLADFIPAAWEEAGRPCAERTVAHALTCAERRIAAHDDARAVLVHGDVHAWNALRADEGFKLIDPDGVLAEAEYDLGVLMREDPPEPTDSDGRTRARALAQRTGLDAEAAWEWAVVERVSTGLLCTQVGLQPAGREMLAVADRLSGA